LAGAAVAADEGGALAAAGKLVKSGTDGFRV